MIRTKFRQCEAPGCTSEYGRKRGKVVRCDRHAPRPEKKSAFPDQRQPEFTTWLMQQRCCVLGKTGKRVMPNGKTVSWTHEKCFGPVTPAHVFRKRAQGVPDLGECVPLCVGAHTASEHNQENNRVEFWDWYSMDRVEEAAKYAKLFLGDADA